MGDIVKQILAKPIQLADQVTKSIDDVQSFKQDCLELKSKTEKLASLLRQASQSSSDFYQRPIILRIIDDTEQVLDEALTLVKKCCRGSNGTCLMKRLFTIVNNIIPATSFHHCLMSLFTIINIPATAAFKKMSTQLEILIGDVSWLLGVTVFSDEYMGLSLIAQNEIILCLIREQIDTLCIDDDDDSDRSDAAAASLVSSLVSDNDRYGNLIIQEGGVGPLLKLVEEGNENAARAIGLLGRVPKRVEHMIHAGVCDVFEKILKEGPMKVQSMVAWAISELATNHPKCKDHFAENSIIPLLVNHLDYFGTIDREYEDPVTKVSMTSMAAKALWHLAKGSSIICRRITESVALILFAVLLEYCTDDEVQFNSVMALMEIAAVAEEDTELRLSSFNPNTLAAKAVFDQLLRIIEQEDFNSRISCIMTMGYLARTFQTTETRIIGTLVKLLENIDDEVCRVAAFALSKFACTGCSLHIDNCKAIINEGGTRHLIQMIYFGERCVQTQALIVLSYMALHLPDSEELAQAQILTMLEWASKQDSMIRDPTVETLLLEAKSRMELYLSAQRQRYMIEVINRYYPKF